VEVAADRLKQLNPLMIVDTHACHIGTANIDSLLDGIDVVIDALDNFETRRIINRACLQKKIPYIFCGVSARSGNITVFNLKEKSPCFSCLYHGINDNDIESCDITGIHPTLLPILTGIQVHEAISILLKGDSSLDGSLLFIDLQRLNFDKIPIQKNSTCSVCSGISEIPIQISTNEWIPLDICGENNFMLVPQMNVHFDISKIKSQLEKDNTITTMGTHSLTLSLPNKTLVTIFRGGNILIRGVATPNRASEIWEDIKTKYSY
jgi:adenylyltransferase/sulfurtransferase